MAGELSRIDLVSRIDLMIKAGLMSKVDLMHGSNLTISWMNRVYYLVKELMHRVMMKRISLMSWMLMMNALMGSIMDRTAGLMNSIRRVCVRQLVYLA